MPIDASRIEHSYHLSPADFERIRRLIYARAGISLHENKQAMVYSRLSRRLRDLQLPDFATYLSLLERGGGEADARLVTRAEHRDEARRRIGAARVVART